MGEIYYAKDVHEAISLAKDFKARGTYNLFRGQAKNWSVMPSLGRLLPNMALETKEKFDRLFMFFESTPALNKYKKDADWFWAIAQHYGLPTNYIDFTLNPEVAAFFATNDPANLLEEQCVIVCLDELDFMSFMDGLKTHFKEEDVIPPYVARIDVDNLWRLQAQEGCFLFTPYNRIEFYYDFDRILFPYTKPYRGISKGNIYPARKSELEIYMDQFFNSEERHEGYLRFKKFAETLKVPVTTIGELEYDHLFKSKKTHQSWRSANYKLWDFPLSEPWKTDDKKKHLHLSYDHDLPSETQTKLLTIQLKALFEERHVHRTTYLRFHIDCKNKVSKKFLSIISRSCSRLWDGTRNLPFTNEEIVEMISRYIVLEMKEQQGIKAIFDTDEKLILLEMQSKYGSITRCRVTPRILVSALRTDLYDVLSEQAPKGLQPEILLHINNPRLIFDFSKLLLVFKKEIICYQVLYNSEKDNPVIFYTPAQVDVLGYA